MSRTRCAVPRCRSREPDILLEGRPICERCWSKYRAERYGLDELRKLVGLPLVEKGSRPRSERPIKRAPQTREKYVDIVDTEE